MPRTRSYQVLDIDISTYEHSHNFLRRYQLLYLMKRIVEEEFKPIEDRTINYFVDVYLRKFYFTDWHRYNRWIYDERFDSDVDDHGRTRLPRHPRPIHRSELISIFAAHAEWIYEDQRAKRPRLRLVDLDVWSEFCSRVKKDREDAARWGIRWGLARGAELGHSDEDGQTEMKVHGKWKKGKKRKGKHRIGSKPALVPSPKSEPSESEIEQPGPKRKDGFYDDEFSPASTPAASDPEYLSEPAIDPELLALIPRSFSYPPSLPGCDFTWRCDVRRCSYQLNLLNLSDEDVEHLPKDMVNEVRSRRWASVLEDRVVVAFYRMVDRHRRQHLAQWGVEFTDPMTSKVKRFLTWYL
jgi:hypothetical protein